MAPVCSHLSDRSTARISALTIDGSGSTLIGTPLGIGRGSVTKQGSGALFLSGANHYSGGTFVRGGTLFGDTTSLQGRIANNAVVVFDQAQSGTYTGVMSGTGVLFKRSTGVLFLTGANTYTGGTGVLEGTLQGDTREPAGRHRRRRRVVFDQRWTERTPAACSGQGP